jgi:hypothetical protein
MVSPQVDATRAPTIGSAGSEATGLAPPSMIAKGMGRPGAQASGRFVYVLRNKPSPPSMGARIGGNLENVMQIVAASGLILTISCALRARRARHDGTSYRAVPIGRAAAAVMCRLQDQPR